METFESDLSIVQHEYYSWAKSFPENQAKLLQELHDAIDENRERIIKELQAIDKNVLEWNRFVESTIDKYKGQEDLIRQLEKYSIQPQR